MVVLAHAPLLTREVLVVDGALFVLVAQALLRAFLALTVKPNNAVGTEGKIRVNEHIHHVLALTQDVIRRAADDHAGLLLRNLQNDLALNAPEEIGRGHAAHHAGCAGEIERIRQRIACGGKLTVFLDIFRIKAAFQRNLFNQFFVVILDAQLLGQLLADAASAAAKLTSDGDDAFLFHKNSLLFKGYLHHFTCYLLHFAIK